jgi:hypothetical protein
MSRGELVPMAALMGLLIGSLLTVVAERVPQGGSVAPPSRCGNCGLRIEPLVLELATALLFVIFALKFHDDGVLPAFCILAATLVVQSWIDLNTQTLPRPITLWGTGLGAIALALAALVNGEPERIWMAALGAGIALALIGGIYWGSSLYYGSLMSCCHRCSGCISATSTRASWCPASSLASSLVRWLVSVRSSGARRASKRHCRLGLSWHSAPSLRCSSDSISSTSFLLADPGGRVSRFP